MHTTKFTHKRRWTIHRVHSMKSIINMKYPSMIQVKLHFTKRCSKLSHHRREIYKFQSTQLISNLHTAAEYLSQRQWQFRISLSFQLELIGLFYKYWTKHQANSLKIHSISHLQFKKSQLVALSNSMLNSRLLNLTVTFSKLLSVSSIY